MMDKNALWKWLSLIAFTAFSLALVYPPKDRIKLGLDLKGGISLVLQLDMEGLSADAREDALDRALEVIRNRVDAIGTEEPNIYPEPQNNRIVVQIPGLDAEDLEATKILLTDKAFLEFRMVKEDNDEIIANLRKSLQEGEKVRTRPGFRPDPLPSSSG